jgi:hypothetical protein
MQTPPTTSPGVWFILILALFFGPETRGKELVPDLVVA